ncbi:hypothetical protein P153DRAFT_108284 [Dothidotthia symphoricarpi CBS 119687]|uniref:Uncharacterized protein n=1 Tax=Dothidotthia symphoricarpi CBS 119687 TaxID=1392245 RepID=A0A6A6ATU2_9PLEO|nr:uncharacterized protein P153DRAFT_108284 [Dothidotthia symphoricarpi CBS 119687]KAF2134257.1 hypothetical protein P153DRAFT_108284 [Dothidotthia symphoricarpi CBS 119687]
MGRFDTLNDDTKDLVNCLLPALAASFKLSNAVDIIPEDIRMRAWDCEKRDHIKDQTENDPRNWGVQFLKDLMAISRLKGGNLTVFHTDLREKVAKHEPKHPWCRLADIKEIKDDYENPGRKNEIKPTTQYSSSGSSTDSYFEELVEPEDPKGRKRGRKQHNHEVYEARVQETRKRRKYGSHGRLRRAEDGGFHRKDKHDRRRKHSYSVERATPNTDRRPVHRRLIPSDDDDNTNDTSLYPRHTPILSISPAPRRAHPYAVEDFDITNEPLAVQKLQAELEVAEAELKAARLKYAYIQAKEAAESQSPFSGNGMENEAYSGN